LRRVKKLLAAIAAVVVVVVVIVLTRHGTEASVRPANATPVAAATTSDAAGAATPSRIKKITPDERRELAQKIDAARAARGGAATRAEERPHLPERKAATFNDLPPDAVAVLNEALPYLDACYNHGSNNYGPNLAVALVTLHGAPDVGTLVDASEIHDDKGAPVDRDIADCLASTLQSLQLPPIDSTTDVGVQFSFRY
jgi:hypothetical protein